MKIIEITKYLNAKVCNECNMDKQVVSACGADLMSDVLAFVKHNTVLLTGLVNQHVVRTAEMVDVSCIIFVRGETAYRRYLRIGKRKGDHIIGNGSQHV